MIFLTTTAKTPDGVARQVAGARGSIDGVELRIDLLDPPHRERVLELARVIREAGGEDLLIIATVRRECDGGRADCPDSLRFDLLGAAVRAGVDYIDLESDLPDDEAHRALLLLAREAGIAVIRSHHDYSGVPPGLTDLVRNLPRAPGEIAKCAVTPRSTADLVTLLETAHELGDLPRILLGMGEYGFPSRVLVHRLGNLLTFASTVGDSAAPGHVSPQELASLYRVGRHTDATRLFAVIGSPIVHSKSPDYHNARFAEEGIDACYLPVLVDDVGAFFDLADRLPIFGFSVTIPHKRTVIPFLSEAGDDVRAADACNTVVRIPAGWRGVNTDVLGFLAPLEEVLDAAPAGVRVLVLGAGGAARGVVYALVSRGAQAFLWNRTASRADALAADLRAITGPRAMTGPPAITVLKAGSAGAPESVPMMDVVVNTTSVGMHGEGDPAPWYEFGGHEIAYDIVYTPPETPFLERAARAGCRVITGDRMFAAQAAAQYELYRVLATADSGDA